MFSDYALFYDLIYSQKDYIRESQYVHNVILKYGMKQESILDMGCGSGKHLNYFLGKNYAVTGVDKSSVMLDFAKKNINYDVELVCDDMIYAKLENEYSAVLSLFNVISYISNDIDLNSFFININQHLIIGGVFVFDFWNADAVFKNPPIDKQITMENDDIKLTRTTTTRWIKNNNTLDIDWNFNGLEKQTNKDIKFNEGHKCRYYYTAELERALIKSGFEVIFVNKWLSDGLLTDEDWYGCICARKKIHI